MVLQGPACYSSVSNRRNGMQPPPRAPGWPSSQECEACVQVWVLPSPQGGEALRKEPRVCLTPLLWLSSSLEDSK